MALGREDEQEFMLKMVVFAKTVIITLQNFFQDVPVATV